MDTTSLEVENRNAELSELARVYGPVQIVRDYLDRFKLNYHPHMELFHYLR